MQAAEDRQDHSGVHIRHVVRPRDFSRFEPRDYGLRVLTAVDMLTQAVRSWLDYPAY